MLTMEGSSSEMAELSPAAVREQLERLAHDDVLRSSRRSVQFLRYIVEETLKGAAEQIKERTIGVHVFGRDPSYDTSTDHVVRQAAIELRKRLAIYYGDPRHRDEVRMSLVPGSYVPRFSQPAPASSPALTEAVAPPSSAPDVALSAQPMSAAASGARSRPWLMLLPWVLVACLAMFLAVTHWHRRSALELFWGPVLDARGSVLLAVGAIPNGPPGKSADVNEPAPVIQKSLADSVPLSDAVTLGRVLSTLRLHGKDANVRPESSRSFSDFRDGPVVLIGAFNNEWSLRLTQNLRFSLALDRERNLIYIRDAQHPGSREWSQVTAPTIEAQQALRGGPTRHDFALISRTWNPDTGQPVLILGGLYAFGTAAAGEFLTDPEQMKQLSQRLPLANSRANLQVVLETPVTDDTPGVPRILAVSAN